ncbi:tetratricopeptide repeat protein [Thermodesulfobacteriota bacterium]
MRKIFLIGMLLILFVVSCKTNQEALKRQAEASRQLAGAYINQKKYTLALRELLKAEQFYDEDPDLHNDLGFVYMQKNSLDLSVKHFKQALELRPDFASAKNNLGVAYMKKKQWDEAIVCFKELLENLVYTTPQKPMVNLGWVYYNKKEYMLSAMYYNNALDLFREGLAKDNDYLMSVYGLSQTYLAEEKSYLAVKILEEGLKDAPRAYPLYYNLGKAYQINKDFDKSSRAYQKVVELAPESDLGEKAKIVLDTMGALRK